MVVNGLCVIAIGAVETFLSIVTALNQPVHIVFYNTEDLFSECFEKHDFKLSVFYLDQVFEFEVDVESFGTSAPGAH
jgi:hypothetical protein